MCVCLFRQSDNTPMRDNDAEQPKHVENGQSDRDSHTHSLATTLKQGGNAVFSACFFGGELTIRTVRYLAQRLYRLVTPIGHGFCRIGLFIKKKIFKVINRERKLWAQDKLFLAEYKEKMKQQRLFARLRMAVKIPFFSIYRHRRILLNTITLLFPVLASLVLYNTLQYWGGVTFGLAVEYQGKKIGYITDEAIFSAGVDMASDRIINTEENSFQVERTPHLTLAVVNQNKFLTDSEICDKILETSGDEIAEVSGLYINGMFEGAVESRDALDALLKSILNGYMKNNTSSSNSSVNAAFKVLSSNAEFVDEVTILDGLYPVSAVMSTQEMQNKLTANSIVDKFYTVVAGDTLSRIARVNNMTVKELYAMNSGLTETIRVGDQIRVQKAQPYLQVQVVQEIQYDEVVPYKTVEKKSSSYYVGYRKVKKAGKNGSQRITAKRVLLDGVEESVIVTKTVVTKEAVDQIVTVGTRSTSGASKPSGSVTATGNFISPVPHSHLIYSPYGWRKGKMHKGIDIAGSNIYGKNILAADGGRVIQTDQTDGPGYWSYGKYLMIDHGNGFVTVYAHCSSVLVKTGDRVSQGQVIAKVGNTGRSTGPHLHFEIRYKGSTVNPTGYVR